MSNKYKITSRFGYHSIINKRTNVILANYKDLNTARNHLNDLKNKQKENENDTLQK